MCVSSRKLIIRSGQGDYEANFYDSLQGIVETLCRIPQTVVLVDANVADLYRDQLRPLLKTVPVLAISATEEEKTIVGVSRVLDFLQSNGATKQTVAIAIGGGIIEDMVTFSSHVYYRGIKWVYVPTTLLSMCDSCIGAKCGINHNAFKNQLGVFHAPGRVLINTCFLETLSDVDVQSGYGEIVKLLLTGSRGQYESFCETIDHAGFRNSETAEFIAQSLIVKKGIIEKDEYEQDMRRILNYGHTFGHSLESITHHEVSHGIAVAWGIDIVNFIAFRRGLLRDQDYKNIHRFLQRHFRFRIKAPVTARDLVEGVKRDKKMMDGKICLVLLAEPGELRLIPTSLDEQLIADVELYLRDQSVIYWH